MQFLNFSRKNSQNGLEQGRKSFQEAVNVLAKGMSRKKQIKEYMVLVRIHCICKKETFI